MGRKTNQNRYFTEEKWEKVNIDNKLLIDEFIAACEGLDRTSETIEKYRNALQIAFIFFMESCGNKFFVNITRLDILKLQNYLLNTVKVGSARIRFIKATLSSLSNFIETYYEKEYPNFRNIVGKVEHPAKVAKREKTFLTQEQLNQLFKYLEEKEDWRKLTLVALALESGARKGEIFQVTKDCVDNKQKNGMYKTNIVRGKGKGKEGKQFYLAFSEFTTKYMRGYLATRGQDDCPYLFVFKDRDGEVKPLKPEAFNKYCEEFTKVLGVPVYPHCFRGTRANLLLEAGVDINKIKSLLHHSSSETTTQHYVKKRDEEDIEDIFTT